MRAEFEEKSYEQHLTTELVHERQFFPPGQVLEDIVGFDVALLTFNGQFWRLFPSLCPWKVSSIGRLPFGIILRNEMWKELADTINRFPPFKFNCFVQAKRPERMSRSDSAEYSSWKRPYFRFDVFESQQKALIHLADHAATKAVVVYACPAFHTYSELWDAVRTGRLVQDSNFCEVSKLAGHGRYSFVTSGSSGIAHSEPTPVESTPFEQLLSRASDQRRPESNVAFIVAAGEAIESAAEHLGDLRPTYRSIASALFSGVDSKLARAFAQIRSFEFVCNAQLLIHHEG